LLLIIFELLLLDYQLILQLLLLNYHLILQLLLLKEKECNINLISKLAPLQKERDWGEVKTKGGVELR